MMCLLLDIGNSNQKYLGIRMHGQIAELRTKQYCTHKCDA